MYHPPGTPGSPGTTRSEPARPALGGYGARASISSPLADLQVYEPGAALALTILMLPIALTLGLAALALHITRTVPIWLPSLALLWLPAVPLLWLLLLSARTTATGIAVARPWRTWTQLRWDQIQHVDQRGLVMRISGAGETLVLAPRLLREGARLRRQILLRLPPHALSVRLSREAEEILSSRMTVLADGSVTGAVVARPLARYWVVPLVAACLLGAGAGLAFWLLSPAPANLIAAALAVLLALICLAGAVWPMQRLALDDGGITITRAVGFPRHRFFAWERIKMVEHTPGHALLRIRDSHTRTLCAGPHLFDAELATVLWALIQSHAAEHGVLIIPRRRLPS